MDETIAHPDIDPLKAIGRMTECTRRLLQGGLTWDDLQAAIDDPVLRSRVIKYWKAGGKPTPTSFNSATEILGNHFILPSMVVGLLGLSYDQEEESPLWQGIPFSESELEACAEDHLLFPGMADLTINVLRAHGRARHFDATASWDRYQQELNATSMQSRWYLVRMTPMNPVIPFGTSHLSPQQREALYGDMSERPSACTVIYMALLWHQLSGKWLFEGDRVLTSDRGGAVWVGVDQGYISIGEAYGEHVVPSRKY